MFPFFILDHAAVSFSLFHVCFMLDSGFYVFPPLGVKLFPHFSFGIHGFPWSLDHAPLSPWAQGPAEVFALRRWLTTRKFDMKQMKTVLKMITK